MIPFNKPYYTGRELKYVAEAFERGQTAGNGEFTRRCQNFFEERYGFPKCLLTQSCTDALEMCALLARIEPGDEVIVPSYTFVSTANAFVLRGATIKFADSEVGRPHVCPADIERLITPRTKVIVVVHYGGTAVDLTRILEVARRHGILVVEDAAQAVDSRYHGRPLGSLGDLATFSFHETKNIISGEGGMLVINRADLCERAEILWEKGTNRSAFFRGEVAKYQWIDVGSSFLPSELTAATLWSQLESLDEIQSRRVALWHRYDESLREVVARNGLGSPLIGEGGTVNGHLYYLICRSLEERTELIAHLKRGGVHAVFHYQSLHSSPFHPAGSVDGELPNSDRFTDRLLRLPMFYSLSEDDVAVAVAGIEEFYGRR